MKKKFLPLFAIISFIAFSCTDDSITIDDVDIEAIAAGLTETSLTIGEADPTKTITVNFGAEIPSNIKFNVAISGTAVYGTDYTTTLDEANEAYFLSVPAGATAKEFAFTPIDDDLLDAEDLTAIFTITSDDERIDLGDGVFTVTIENDDIFTDIELFLLNSVKLTKANLDTDCGGQPVVIINYDDDGFPTEVVYDYTLYANILRIENDGNIGTIQTFTVNYDTDSIWFTDPSVTTRVGETDNVALIAKISDGRVSELISKGGRKRRVDGPEIGPEGPPPVTSLSYDESGRIESYITDYDGEYSSGYTFDYASSTEVDVYEFSGEGPRTESDPDSFTMDGKNNPFEGFASLVMRLDGRSADRIFFHTILPSNLESGYESSNGPIVNSYAYNSNDYPTESATLKGYAESRVSSDSDLRTWLFTFQYADMDGGDDPVPNNLDFCD